MLKALNMYQGEIYAYPLTLQWVISQDYSTMKFICQDAICKYFPWMMKVLDKPINIPGIDALRQCKPFLSVMHGKAHNWSCQVCNDCLFCLIFSHVFLWDGGEKSERVSYFCFDRKGNKIIDKMGRKMAVWIRLCNRRGNGAVRVIATYPQPDWQPKIWVNQASFLSLRQVNGKNRNGILLMWYNDFTEFWS